MELTVTMDADHIRIRTGRPEDFALDYHIQRDEYVRLQLPDNPLTVDVFFMGLKGQPGSDRVSKIVMLAYLDMLAGGQTEPAWTVPVEQPQPGEIRIRAEDIKP